MLSLKPKFSPSYRWFSSKQGRQQPRNQPSGLSESGRALSAWCTPHCYHICTCQLLLAILSALKWWTGVGVPWQHNVLWLSNTRATASSGLSSPLSDVASLPTCKADKHNFLPTGKRSHGISHLWSSYPRLSASMCNNESTSLHRAASCCHSHPVKY